MFRFIKQYADKMNDAAIFPVVSFFIFFIFFIILLVMVKNMKKEKLKELSNIPFEKEEIENTTLKF